MSEAAARLDILLIEDEPNIAEAIRFILTRDGYSFRHCADGHDAVAQVRALQPRMVILDVMLPGRSGVEVLGDLRADPALAGLKVLILTARGGRACDSAVTQADAHMSKPFSNDSLRETIRAMLAADDAG